MASPIRRCVALSLLILLSLPVIPASALTTDWPTPPEQPAEGPGGSNYTHATVRETKVGRGASQFWIFEPADPTPQTAPLIVFNHGWSAVFPFVYKAWIDHLVRHGNIVVYPRYQRWIAAAKAVDNAVAAVKEAISVMQAGDHVLPDLERFAIVGHSLGAGISAMMAATANASGLPVPKAVMPVQPALRYDIMERNYSGIPAETLLLVVVGEDDTIVGTDWGKVIFTTATNVPADRKDFIIQHTDTYGEPALIADHFAPLAATSFMTVDAMDYFSTWKLFDALTDYAFYGTHREYCLGNTPEQRFMGLWSDGTPVRELTVTDTP